MRAYTCLKVLHVTPYFYPAQVYGGLVEAEWQLCRHLSRQDCHIKVLTTDANGSASLTVETDRDVVLPDDVHVRYCKRWAGQSVAPALVRFLPSLVRWADIVHLTAVYSFPTIPTLLICRLLNKPVVWSPHGSLQRWAGSRRVLAKSLWEQVCRLVAPRSTVIHVTSPEEAKESMARFPGFGSAVISNGMDIPASVMRKSSSDRLRLLFMGRLDPKKGLENLLAACRIIKKECSGTEWALVIAGAGDQRYEGSLKALAERYGLSGQVRFAGHVNADQKAALFSEADVLVMPSFTENFGMVAAEALAHRVPVIASTGTPWKRLEEIGCGLWVDNDPDTLSKAIRRMAQMPLVEMGGLGREWIQCEFAWGAVAQAMTEQYRAFVSAVR